VITASVFVDLLVAGNATSVVTASVFVDLLVAENAMSVSVRLC